MTTYKGYLKSVIGVLEIICNDIALVAINFVDIEKDENPNNIVKQTKEQLTEYFEGKREAFTIPLNIVGTDFQKLVWAELQKIPYGKTASYKQIAQNINNPKAVRAVGTANSKNKIPIIIPCHRVIGNNGKLSGYAGGVWRKEKLLEIEKYKNKISN